MSLLQATKNLEYGPDPLQTLDVYPAAKPNSPVVIFWHGGGWQRGDKVHYGFMGRTLQRMGYAAIIPNYRLFPAVSFPLFNEDGAAAVKWTIENSSIYGGNPSKLFLMGHSAGAHIAAFLAYQAKWLMDTKVPLSSIRGFIGLSGPYDFYPGKRYRPVFDVSDSSQPWNPINFVDKDPVPALLVHGGLDWVVKNTNSVRMAERLRSADGDCTLRIYPLVEHQGTVAAMARPLAWIGVQGQVKRFIDRQIASAD